MSSPAPVTLDVVVPTYKRSLLLRKTLDSLLRASLPEGLRVTVFVVDNNSRDDTRDVVQTYVDQSSTIPVRYVSEVRQGSSNARNAGILAGTGELIGFIDDDEEVDPTWFTTVLREFTDPATQFIGGPYLPNWVSPVPDWLPPGYHSVIGAIPPKPRAVYGLETEAVLMGGNAVLRRSVYDRVGYYNPNLGRTAHGLLSEEDAEFFKRVKRAGLHGIYVPDLIIHHYIAPERLNRRYHRRWVYWRAVSQGLLSRTQRESVSHLLGVPRYLIGSAIRSLLSIPRTRNKAVRFAHELSAWHLIGFFWGRFFFKPRTT